MKLPKNFTRKGFTLIEILVVSAIFTMLAGVGFFVSLDSLRGYAFRSEWQTTVRLLQKARGQAMSNLYHLPHGVHIENGLYTLFRGASYSTSDFRNEETVIHPGVIVSGLSQVIFSELSGDANVTGTIVLTDGLRSKTITINHEGGINW